MPLVRFGDSMARVTPPDFAWTKKTQASDLFAPGDVDLFQIKEIKGAKLHVTLDQYPNVQGAMLVIDNRHGRHQGDGRGIRLERQQI